MRIRTRSLIIMFSQGITQATTILLGIILVRLISQETLGTYRQVFLVFTFLSGLLSLQLENSLYYFLPKCQIEQRRSLLLQTVATKIVFALITCLVMLIGAGIIAGMFSNPELRTLLPVFSLYALTSSIIPLIPAFMISVDRAVRAGLYSMADSVSRVGIVVVMFAMGFSLASVLWASVIAAGIVSAFGLLDMMRLCSAGRWRFDRPLFFDQLSYTWPFLAISLIGIVNVQLDKFLISVFFDPATYAIYSCGAIELPIIALITGSVTAAIMPNLVTFAQQGEVLKALDLWKEAVRKTALIIFPCFAFFIFAGKSVIILLYKSEYSMAVWPFSVYLFLLPIRIATYGTLFRAVGKTKPIATAAGLNLIFNVVLSSALAWLGHKTLLTFIGPSIGAVAANVAAAGFLLWQLSRILNIPVSLVMNWKELAELMLISVVCGIGAVIVPLPGLVLIAEIIIRAAIFSVLVFAAFAIFKVLKADEKSMLLLPIRVLCGRIACVKG